MIYQTQVSVPHYSKALNLDKDIKKMSWVGNAIRISKSRPAAAKICDQKLQWLQSMENNETTNSVISVSAMSMTNLRGATVFLYWRLGINFWGLERCV